MKLVRHTHSCVLQTYIFDLDDITRDNLRRGNLSEVTITKSSSTESERLLEFVDDRTGLEFLDETNGGVEQEKSADDTKVNPILKTGGKNGGSLVCVS